MTTSGGSQLAIWPCRDGYLTFNMYGGSTGMRTNRTLVEWMDNKGMSSDFLKEKDWSSLDIMQITEEELQRISEAIGKFFLKQTKADILKAMLEKRMMIAPVSGINDLVNDPQLKARGFWVDLEHEELGTAISYPGAFAKLSETPCKMSRRAPLIGEHNNQIPQLLLERQEITPTKGKLDDEKITRRPLEGIKVADFSWVTTGPLITKYLADLGAEVVHIETSLRPDVMRTSAPYKENIADVDRAAFFAYFNNNKYGVTLNLKNPRGVEIAKKIVAWADIIVEAFRPGTMGQYGLNYDGVKKIKGDIIMLSVSSQGQTGPGASVIGMGLHVASLCGFTDLTGWPDKPPCVPVGAYPDYISPRFGLAALIATLDYRRRTGKGQYIDLSQYESSLQFLAPALLDFRVNGRIISRNGNYCTNAAPHGVYPCLGEDKWCAISVFTEEEWDNCSKAMGSPPWAKDLRFSTMAKRKENEVDLDALVGQWTKSHDAKEVMEIMQSYGIPAGIVENCDDTYHDPQLRYRNYLTQLKHPKIGKHSYQCPSFRLSRIVLNPTKPAPCLGEHNYVFYTQVLGMSDEEFVELHRAGVFD
jgi:benzylsuccinate CoA-transferase BbsF subunit